VAFKRFALRGNHQRNVRRRRRHQDYRRADGNTGVGWKTVDSRQEIQSRSRPGAVGVAARAGLRMTVLLLSA